MKTLLAIPFLSAAILLSGCSAIESDAGKVASSISSFVSSPGAKAAISYIESQAEAIGKTVVLGAATSEVDSSFKGNFLGYIAKELETNEGTITQASQIETIIQNAAPDDGTAWQQLASQLAGQYATAQSAAGHPKSAQIVQAIANGLYSSAASPPPVAAVASPSPSPVVSGTNTPPPVSTGTTAL